MPDSPLALRSDGLGVVAFGDPVEDALAILTDLFGSPTYDQILQSPFEAPDSAAEPDRGVVACHVATVPVFGGYACFDYIRVTSWSDVGLQVVFSDLMVSRDGNGFLGDSAHYVQVSPSLRGYGYWAGDIGPSAQTIHGIAVGSTAREVMAVGDQVRFLGPGCGDNAEFSVAGQGNDPGSRINGVFDYDGPWETLDSGDLDPTSIDPAAPVLWLGAGAQRSC